jgi:hypothetical protein
MSTNTLSNAIQTYLSTKEAIQLTYIRSDAEAGNITANDITAIGYLDTENSDHTQAITFLLNGIKDSDAAISRTIALNDAHLFGLMLRSSTIRRRLLSSVTEEKLTSEPIENVNLALFRAMLQNSSSELFLEIIKQRSKDDITAAIITAPEIR